MLIDAEVNSTMNRLADSLSNDSSSAPADKAFWEDEEMIREFITEAGEHLSRIEGQLLLLEQDNKDVETLNAVFRAFHTVKGLAGFLEFPSIQSLAHEIESLLDLARTLQLEVTSEVIDLVLESTDLLCQELRSIESIVNGEKRMPASDHDPLIKRIRHVVSAGPDQPVLLGQSNLLSTMTQDVIETSFAKVLRETEAARNEISRPDLSASLRIDTGKLDQLMDLVGELVIAHTLIGHSLAPTALRDARLSRDLNQMTRIIANLQRITTGMRMVPIGQQFQKTARLVRDLSRKAGKQILLETTGEDTELDKTIAEELSDPMLHMVRNSIDHGIEAVAERSASGKNPVAHIRIAAYHSSGQVVIEIADDGRGLDRKKILKKAVQTGLVGADVALSDTEIFQLIFEAGFSTADTVTEISGRGVGMDVVRKHVQKLRGRIEVESQTGIGTTFRIKLPLTLAIIDGLKIVVGAENYIVPASCVREMFRPTEEILSSVHSTGEMVLVRGNLLPIIRLHRRFGVEPRTTRLAEGVLIVIASGERQFCLFVDELAGKQEVVIKSLGTPFKNVEGVSGCAILGDGRVGLILDVDELYKGRN